MDVSKDGLYREEQIIQSIYFPYVSNGAKVHAWELQATFSDMCAV